MSEQPLKEKYPYFFNQLKMERLEAENARLKAECQARQAENSVLAVECDSLKAEVERLENNCEYLDQKLDEELDKGKQS